MNHIKITELENTMKYLANDREKLNMALTELDLEFQLTGTMTMIVSCSSNVRTLLYVNQLLQNYKFLFNVLD